MKKEHKIVTVTIILLIQLVCSGEENKVDALSDGSYHLNSDDFFPIGMYHADSIATFSELKAAGFNALHGYGWEGRADYWLSDGAEWLDAAHQHGMKGLVGFDRRWVQSLDFDSVGKVVEKYKDHPAVLAWHVMDEPAVGRIRHWPKDVGVSGDVFMPKMYDYICSLDTLHPITAVFPQFREVESFIHTVDIFQTTYYPIPAVPEQNYVGTGFRGFGNFASRILRGNQVEGYEGGKAWWPVLQIYAKTGYDLPTETELRGMTYSVIAMGADGVFYWSLVQMRNATGQDDFFESEQWQNLAKLTREVEALQPVLLDHTEEHFVQVGSIRALVKNHGDNTYVILANVEREATEAFITIPEVGNGKAEVLFGRGEAVMVEAGQLHVALEAIESRVYRIKNR